MKNKMKLALVSFGLLCLGVEGVLHAQGYLVNAQITGQAAGGGLYNYTIKLNNASSSTASIGEFWFAWVPDNYAYDLLPSSPTVTQAPAGWYYGVYNGNYYYPDGYSIQFYNFSGLSLAPGASDTFKFTSADSPATLGQNSPFYGIPALTSYAYDDSGSDPGTEFLVTPAAAPEPSVTSLLGVCAACLLFANRRRMSPLKQPIPPNRM
jgi:hypothetical protein